MHSGRLEINPQFVLVPEEPRVKQVEGLFTDDGVFLEEAVVALAAAHLEDQLADVEQVVSADVQLRRSTTRHTFRFPTFWIPSLPAERRERGCVWGGGVSGTHSQAESGDAQVQPG